MAKRKTMAMLMDEIDQLLDRQNGLISELDLARAEIREAKRKERDARNTLVQHDDKLRRTEAELFQVRNGIADLRHTFEIHVDLYMKLKYPGSRIREAQCMSVYPEKWEDRVKYKRDDLPDDAQAILILFDLIKECEAFGPRKIPNFC